jgi:hypothetical protein
MAKHSKTSRRGRKQRRGYRRTQKGGMYWKPYIPSITKK